MKTSVIKIFAVFFIGILAFVALSVIIEAQGFQLFEYVGSVLLAAFLITVFCLFMGLIFGAASVNFQDGMSAAFIVWRFAIIALIVLAIFEPPILMAILR